MASSSNILVIGSGIGGLCCGALLARYGHSVTVCESHTIAGGAAHGFERQGYTFDSGPSLYSGMSYRGSTNPLRHVLDAIGEADSITWANYDTWGVRIPEGNFDTTVGNHQFAEVLQSLRGDAAVQDWRRLQKAMEPLGKAATALPPAALRLDLGALQTVASYGWDLLRNAPALTQSSKPFSTVLDRTTRDPFIRNWMNLLCFLLSGLPAEGTSTAEMAFMFAEWYRPGVTLDYPIGGSAAMVDALVRGLEKFGGTLRLGAHVEQILVEGGRATGVALRSGEILPADTVISNASIWDTLKLVPDGALPKPFVEERQATPECPSFLHLHLGIDGANLPPDLACHYITVEDWARGIDAPRNLIVMSIPSVLDPSLAPPGKHTIHVYTPATEPYELWQGLDRRSPEYAALKQTRAEPLWRALERIIPDVRQRVEVELVGTPLTHERFLRCHRGSYGPAISAQDGLFPGPKTPLEGLLCVGGSTFPGIGLPAVAACGLITANTLASVSQQRQMLREVLG
ncbi:NAD(P)/FAD-dependent oxidoreductase [Nodosilinea sp. LEGE 07298]|uniref:phytoene desaturase family protein n=1 Tax=Nodosilinea sp. LEGE 07298 TaxID=2777970 RepID=UPI00187F4D7B|nr:NAD(P)/FAD-dependent oxidoreductase [Nodosilinea sp. LEGE 07298]MBE9107993.1 NAD(P)/FAD-dependent oxidoreductase [Nodosilinea sp. LEGE 07298]